MTPIASLALELLLKSTALLAIAAAVNCRTRGGARIFRGSSAARRHLVWTAMFAAMFLLPFGHFFTPRWELRWPVAAERPAPAARATSKAILIRADLSPEPRTVPAQPASAAVPPRAFSRGSWPRSPAILVGTWIAGALLVLAARLAGAVRLRALRRCSTQIQQGVAHELSREVGEELGVRSWELRESDRCPVPLTWGTRRPVVMLPLAAKAWPEARLHAALRHEFAHAARRDHLTRLLAQIVCALYWPNPLVWLAARALRTAQEQACDDLVLRAGTRAEDYAAQLLEVARALTAPLPLTRHAVAMAQPSTLRTRIQAIVDERRDRRPATRAATLLAFTAAIACAGVASLTQLRAQAVPTDDLPPLEVASGRLLELEAKFIAVPAAVYARVFPGASEQTGYLATLPETEAAALEAKLIAGGTAPDSSAKAAPVTKTEPFILGAAGVNVLSAPRVTTRDGQRAVIEIIREQRVPARAGGGTETVNEGVTFAAEAHLTAQGARLWFQTILIQRLPGAQPPFTRESFHEINFTWPEQSGLPLAAGESAVVGGWEMAQPGQKLLVFIRARPRSPRSAADEPPGVSATELDRVMLPRVRFATLPLSAAAATLTRLIRKQWSGEKQTLSVIAKPPLDQAEPRVSLDLRNVSATRALRELARVGGCHVYFDDLAVHLARPLPPSALAAADAIILPEVKLNAATLHEALTKLQTLARAAHPRAGDVKIARPEPPEFSEPLITLDLKNAPLSTALALAAELVGAELSATTSVLHVHPTAETPPGATRIVAPALSQGVARRSTPAETRAGENIALEVKFIDLAEDQLSSLEFPIVLPAEPAAISFAGVLTEKPSREFIQRLNALPKVGILAPPPAFTSSGKKATLSMNFSAAADPAKYTVRGVEITPTVGADSTLDLDLAPFVEEYRLVDHAPLFSTRRITTSVSIFPGHTVVLARRHLAKTGRAELILVTASIRAR